LADSRLNPWRGLGGLPREVWLLFATNLINRAGMMVLPFLVLYLTRELGFSLARAGSMLAVYGASAIVFGPIGGRLSDRIGALPVMRVSLIASGLVLLLFPLAKSFTSVAAMTVLWAGCGEMFRPASLAAITHVAAPEQRRQAFALNRLAINLGMSIGPALGGFLATVSFHAMFAVDAVTTLLAGTLLAVTPWRAFSGVNSEAANWQGPRIGPATILHDGRFLVFLAGVVSVGIVFFQHESALPLYLVQYLHLSPAFYGMLFTINTLLIVGLEVPIITATSHWPNRRSLIIGCMLFAIGFGALGMICWSDCYRRGLDVRRDASVPGNVGPPCGHSAGESARRLHGRVQHVAEHFAHGWAVDGNPAPRVARTRQSLGRHVRAGGAGRAADGVFRSSAPSVTRCSRRWILATIISIATEL